MNNYDEGKLLKNIGIMFDDVLEVKLDEKFKEKLGNLPSKNEFYEQTDKIVKELKVIRVEQKMLSQHSSDHSDQLNNLEKIHPNNSHIHAFA